MFAGPGGHTGRSHARRGEQAAPSPSARAECIGEHGGVIPEARRLADLDPIARENQRLQKEVAVLRERVTALERSRWWRLHPRFGVRRVIHRPKPERPPVQTSRNVEPRIAAGATDPVVVRFREEVLARGAFTESWFLSHILTWEPILEELAGRAASVLEIGSFEGLSACFLLWRLPDARLTCIDTFEGSPENLAYGESVSDLENRFDRNVALVDASRLRKLRGDSRRVLLDLTEEGAQFDLVYVDGSHLALDVMVDASLSWPLVASGGVVIFDDYVWTKLGEDSLVRPGPAIDAFLRLVEDHSELLFRAGQVAVRKRPSAPLDFPAAAPP